MYVLQILIQNLADCMLRKKIFPSQAFYRGTIAIFHLDLLVALSELLSAAGQFPPAPALFVICRDVEISGMNSLP